MSFEPKVNILMVDDHSENLLALEAILDDLGQNLVRATSGAQALRQLLNQDFAVILLDVQMPDMDGFETATLIRQRERSRHTPIIFLTAFNTSDNMVFKGYSLGAVDYLFKPIEPSILKSKVAAFVDLYQKTAEIERQATQLALMNAELKKREEMFRSLSACSPVGIFVTDTEGKFTYINPRCQAICGMTHEESLGEGWAERIHPEDREQTITDWNAASSEGQEYKGEFRILTTVGIERWVCLSSSPMISEQNQVMGYVGTLEDITARKQAQEEHIQFIREQTARKEAETANRLKDEFLATLSHELRTPLTSILGWSKLLRQRKLDETATFRALETIERNASLQAQLIEDILDVTRIMRGKLQLNLSPVNLEAAISTVVDSVRLQAEAKNLQLEYILELTNEDTQTNNFSSSSISDSPIRVWGDPNRLQQIVWNLLNNAIKFTTQGGRVEVRLSLSPKEIPDSTLEAYQLAQKGTAHNGQALQVGKPDSTYYKAPSQNTVHLNISPPPCGEETVTRRWLLSTQTSVKIQVIDTGIGISPDFLPHVFDRFRQADGSITRNQGGLGLGLAIVRYLVEMHGGRVYAQSAGVGKGATFTIELPLLEALCQ